jgi:hypothetical protein
MGNNSALIVVLVGVVAVGGFYFYNKDKKLKEAEAGLPGRLERSRQKYGENFEGVSSLDNLIGDALSSKRVATRAFAGRRFPKMKKARSV